MNLKIFIDQKILLLALLISFFCNSQVENYKVSIIKKYCELTKTEYSYRLIDSIVDNKSTTYNYKMVSGKWLSKEVVSDSIWWHMVDVIIPKKIEFNKALLFVGGGTKNDSFNFTNSYLVNKAVKLKSVIAHVSNVPFQPINFKDFPEIQRYEDNLIAYGWDKFLSNGSLDSDSKYLARLPMTRAVIRSMDLIQEITKFNPIPISEFFISGASKRGWTTWTSAAIDNRIIGIAPVVIDLLNLVPSFRHHFKSYGSYSEAVDDYVNFNIMDWMGSSEFDRLLDIVEPYEFKELFEMPKLIINGTIDEFFLPDSWKFYWNKLPDKKYLQYVPNGNHELLGTYRTKNIISFYKKIINNEDIPVFNWQIKKDKFYVKIDPKYDYEIYLWSATSEKRDFRIWEIGRGWKRYKLEKTFNGNYEISAPVKKNHFNASLIEVIFNKSKNYPFRITTGTIVLPDQYMFKDYKQ